MTDPGPSLGWQIAAWCDQFLCHGPGDLKGEPAVMDAEMAAFTVRVYELDGAGRKVVDQALLSRPKGRAKSEYAGQLVCAELLGPVRFDHWAVKGETAWWGYEFERGEPVGRPVRDPFIRCLATEETQTGHTYDNVQVMLGHLAEHHGEHFAPLDIGKTATFVQGGGEVRPSTAGSAGKDGGKETFVVADETHLYVLKVLIDMFDFVAGNCTKRKIAEPWMLQTSTMFQPGQGSVAELTHRRWARALAGLESAPGLLVDHREAPMPEDWFDDEQVAEALAEVYGPAASWMDIPKIIREMRRASKARAVRYWLNREAVEADVAVDPKEWAALDVGGGLPPAGTAVALGFDGSESGDATALVGVEMLSGRTFVVRLWERPDETTPWQVPRADVDSTMRWAQETWQVARTLCDPKGWRSEISEWQATWGKDFVLEYPTNQWSRMQRAVDRWLSSIRECQHHHVADPPEPHLCQHPHDGDPDLARHVGNARLADVNPRKPEAGQVLVKESPTSPLRIDLAVADCLAGEARGQALAAGWKPAPPPAAVSAPPSKPGVVEDLFRPRERLNV